MNNQKSIPHNYTITFDLILVAIAILNLIRYSFDFPVDQEVMMMTRIGQEIISKGFILNDPFSWAPLWCKVPWVIPDWLACILYYLIYQKIGFWGIALLKTIVYGMGYFFIFHYSCRRYGMRPALLAVIVSIYVGRWFLSGRPLIFTAFFMPLMVLLMLNLQQEKISIKHFLLFPLIFIFWVNTHGGFIIGLLIMSLVFFILVYDKARKKGAERYWHKLAIESTIIMSMCIGVCLFLNPYGINSIKYASAFLFSRPVFISTSIEMQSPCLAPQFNIHYFATVIITLLLLLNFYGKSFPRPTLLEISIFIIWLLASLKAARNMQLFSIFLIPIATFVFHKILDYLKGLKLIGNLITLLARCRPYWDTFKIMILFIVLTSFAIQFYQYDLSGKSSEKDLYPVGVKDFLLLNQLPPNLYNPIQYGSYFIFYLYPRYKVSLDGRWHTIYTDRYYAEVHSSIYDRRLLINFLEKFVIDTVVLDRSLKYLDNESNWLLIYQDNEFNVFLRKAGRNDTIIEKFRNDRLDYPDVFEVNSFLYIKYMEIENYGAARKYLMRMIVAFPNEKLFLQSLMRLDSKINEQKGE